LSELVPHAAEEVTIRNPQGLHARPVMRFVDIASTFQARVWVQNVTLKTEKVDGKSAMHMMLLEATPGSILRIEAEGADAEEAVRRLAEAVGEGLESSP
jgi:phosphocarrier protein HPr